MSQPANDLDFDAALDGLQEQMAEHQRRFKGEVTAEANRTLAAQAIRDLETALSTSEPAAQPPQPAQPAPQPSERTEQRRTVDDRTYKIVKEADTTSFRKATEAEAWFLAHAMPRIELLLTKQDRGTFNSPSWRDRVLAALSWQQFNQRRYLHELVTLLEDSCRLFGDWKADIGPKIIVGGR